MAFWLWLLVAIIGAGLVFCMVVHVVTYSDLESDYLNPVDATERLNRFMLPELVALALVAALALLARSVVPLLANGALLAWHAQRKNLIDATQIYPTLSKRKKESLVKLGLYTLMFFYYLYCMMHALVVGRAGGLATGREGRQMI